MDIRLVYPSIDLNSLGKNIRTSLNGIPRIPFPYVWKLKFISGIENSCVGAENQATLNILIFLFKNVGFHSVDVSPLVVYTVKKKFRKSHFRKMHKFTHAVFVVCGSCVA